MIQYEIGSCGYDNAGQNIPFIGIRSHKGIGLWMGLNRTYNTLCIWLPFFIMAIQLPTKFKKYGNTIVDKKYFWYDLRADSFGFYLDFHTGYGLRLPFMDIYLKNKKEKHVWK